MAEKLKDHRDLGRELDLFSFNEVAPGAPFWHPRGMVVILQLEKYLRKVLAKNGYEEISTPILVKKELWERSGHWDLFREQIFQVKVDNEIYGLKPMNCPEACLVYGSNVRSYRDLPLRLAEIGRLHRNELSGVLGGLFRVRQITMDDAHIFLSPEQILEEITSLLKIQNEFYALFGFQPKFFLSTRPTKALGEKRLWDEAEKDLKQALDKNKIKYQLKEKEGAFYGPKIDLEIKDSQGRDWQLATIQLDFQLPERFKLTYTDKEGKKKRPVIIHRAIFGSYERFLGVLLEHLQGRLPVWLAPEQVRVIPISEKNTSYGCKIFEILKEAGIRVDVDMSNATLQKKILEAEKIKIPYLAVVGEREEKSGDIALRKDNKTENLKPEELISRITKELPSY